MALTEQRIIKQVTLLPQEGAIAVQWAHQVLRDGEVITESYHRRAYSGDEKEEFLRSAEGKSAIAAVLGT